MSMPAFPAVVVFEPGPAELTEVAEEDLPEEPVSVEVAFSSLNYKDALAVTGRGKVVRSFPMTCGIDLAGTVVESKDPALVPGDEVVVTGWGLGERHPGGFTTRQRIRPEWALRPPAGLDLRRCMAVGTAGLTAMLCVMALEEGGLRPAGEGGAEVLVTGAAGGVGSFAVALLARLGHRVLASTGRPELERELRSLGAAEVLDRRALASGPERPLLTERWAGAVDTVGSTTLASALSGTRYGGTVAACGLAGGSELPGSVLPFILRAVRLVGVDSVRCPAALRAVAWRRIAELLSVDVLDALHEVRPMSEVVQLAGALLSGTLHGRVVIDPQR